jgi:hypothetical protein
MVPNTYRNLLFLFVFESLYDKQIWNMPTLIDLRARVDILPRLRMDALREKCMYVLDDGVERRGSAGDVMTSILSCGGVLSSAGLVGWATAT